MQNTVPFEQLHQLFETEFTTLGKSLEGLSSLYQRLPVPETLKKRSIDISLKHKSAWYACLVNSNIDVLLLPEYIESRQSRNILIKKETDQYFKSIEQFSKLSGKSNTSLYECILVSGEVIQNTGTDLFSNCVTDSVSCSEHIHAIFENWNLTLSGYGKLESILYAFLEWHIANHNRFVGQRQSVLWLNYQLWKVYGSSVFSLNLENYLFHNWQKEKMDAVNAMKDILNFLKSEVEKSKSSLNILFKEQIDFDQLKSQQRIISGYLFSVGFDVKLPVHIQQLPIIKILLRKGYIELTDLGQKPDIEKIKNALDELFSLGMIFMISEEEERYISLNPSYKESPGRLSKYNNIEEIKPEMDWDGFINQPVKVIIPKVIRTLAEPEPEAEMDTVRKRQKAFLG